jgi:plastocyanin
MRRTTLSAIALLTVLAVTACTATAPGWTYTPAPPATPVPSAAPSGSAGASASVAPSASAGSSAPASAGSGGTPIPLVAQSVAFTTTSLEAPADKPFSIDFDNEDAGILHNVAIRDGAGAEVFSGEIFPGIAHKTYEIKALAAGAYSFHCVVHSNMVGTLTVK